MRASVPLGLVISPTLLNFFVANYPENVETHRKYADDVYAALPSTQFQEVAEALTVHAETVRDLAEEEGLQISTPK